MDIFFYKQQVIFIEIGNGSVRYFSILLELLLEQSRFWSFGKN